MNVTRRQIVGTCLGTVAASIVPAGLRVYAGTTTQFDDGELVVLSDGNLVLPTRFVLPETVSEAEKEEFLKSHKIQSDTFEPDCNLALYRQGDRVVLFDTGAGSHFMPSAGKLFDDLESMAIDASEITDVVFTHAHPDHLWGLVDDFDELAFPDATFYMNALEWDYWRDDNTLNQLPDVRKSFAVGAKNRLAYLEDQIQLFNYGDEVLPGIEAVDTHGHTPGHTSFAIHSGNDAVLVLGDALTHPIISFERANWPSGSDQDQEAGRQTRLALLDRMSHDKMRVLGFHLPHPGLGYVDANGSQYRYVAA